MRYVGGLKRRGADIGGLRVECVDRADAVETVWVSVLEPAFGVAQVPFAVDAIVGKPGACRSRKG